MLEVKSNEGETFAPEHHARFEDALIDAFGGFTRLPGEARGAWKSPDGKRFDDQTIVYVVGVDGLVARGRDLARVAMLAKEHYRQEAIALRYMGTLEIIA